MVRDIQNILKRCVIFCGFAITVLSSQSYSADRYFDGRLRADSLLSSKNILIAKGNVFLESPEMSISSSILKIDTQKNMLWASRDIKVMYRKQEWAPGKLFVDLDLNEVYLRNLNVLMVNPASKYPIYMRVK